MNNEWTDAYATGHLASAIAWYLKTEDRKALKRDYEMFLRNPVCSPALKDTLPKIERRVRR